MKRTLLLGHRGARASLHVPENTPESFELSLQHGCDGFEFDVRRSADGVAVICHDAAVRGLSIERTLAADLELPSLEEVLNSFAARAFLDIELKVDNLEAHAVAALRDHPPQMGYVVSSFRPGVLSAMHDLDPGVPLGFIFEQAEEIDAWRNLPVAWVVPHFELVDPALIEQVHHAEKKIMVWTVNRSEEMEQFAGWGVDAIITDETESAARRLTGSR